MSPINVKCEGCNRTVQAPESTAGEVVKCPTCARELTVPIAGAEAGAGEGELELTCRDCGKVFSVPLERMGEVVNCPSCGSWIPAGQRRRSLLQQEVPMPFTGVKSIVGTLRFLAGFNLLLGIAATIYIGTVYTTKPLVSEVQENIFAKIDLSPQHDDAGEPTGKYTGTVKRPEVTSTREELVVNPPGIYLTILAAIVTIVGTVVLEALRWLVENVRLIAEETGASPTT